MSLLMAGWRTKSAVKYTALKKVSVECLEEYNLNRKFYHDLIAFNFFNGTKNEKTYKMVAFQDPPREIRAQLSRLYDKLDTSIAELYTKLGLSQSRTNQHSPLETKWAFTYYKKYGHWDYDEKNIVSDKEILQPLTSKELLEYMKLF